jgi:nitroreductase
MKLNSFDLLQLIKERRTVSAKDMLTDNNIESEHLNLILEAANWAPTHGLTEPWRFVIIKENAREKFANFQIELFNKINIGKEINQKKLDNLKNNPLSANIILAIIMKRQEAEKIPELEEIEAVACAVQNMHLMAQSLNIGAKWSTGELAYTKEMTQFFGFNADKDKCLGFLYLGYPKTAFPEGKRQTTINEKISYL